MPDVSANTTGQPTMLASSLWCLYRWSLYHCRAPRVPAVQVLARVWSGNGAFLWLRDAWLRAAEAMPVSCAPATARGEPCVGSDGVGVLLASSPPGHSSARVWPRAWVSRHSISV